MKKPSASTHNTSVGPLLVGTMPWAFCVYQMGLGVIAEHLKTVATFILNGSTEYCHNVNYKTTKEKYERNLTQSMAFVQGSSLDIVIESYIQSAEPSVDPEALRETFYQMVEYWKRKARTSP